MPERSTKRWGILLALLGLAAILWVKHLSAPTTTPLPSEERAALGARPLDPRPPARSPSPGPLFTALYGSGPGQLGRKRPVEGNPEAPMSFARARDGSLWVVDQVNHRLQHRDAGGRPLGEIASPVRAPQDVLVTSRGELALLDRLVDHNLTLVDASGSVQRTVSLDGPELARGATISGIFEYRGALYAERKHGPLSLLLDDSGGAPATLPGRPSRDGASFLNAGIIDGRRIYVAVSDAPSAQNRFTREITPDMRTDSIFLLDTDDAGVIYLAISGRAIADATPLARLICLRGSDGATLGERALTPNTMPEETFRDALALPEGGIVYSVRTPLQIVFERVGCP